MNKRLQEWALSFPCSRCAYLGIEKLGTVHVLGKDDKADLQIVAFCYDCARIMMSSRRPRPNGPAKRPRDPDQHSRITQLVPRNHTKSAEVVSGDASPSPVAEARVHVDTLKFHVARLVKAINQLKTSTDRARAISADDLAKTVRPPIARN